MPGHAPADDRQPVIVGVGQLNRRVDQGESELEPTALMLEAIKLAARDSGVPNIVQHTKSIRATHVFSWKSLDPARIVAERLGVSGVHTTYTSVGGNVPQLLVNGAARDIAAGDTDVVIVTGAEAVISRKSHRRAGTTPDWTVQAPGTEPDTWANTKTPLIHEDELNRGLGMPVQLYPIFESAWRNQNGWTLDEDQRQITELWSRFSQVAVDNPHAWNRRFYSPDELASPDEGNRMIGFPYRKLLVSNEHVDQGAALIMCSVAKARSLGIPTDRWIFPVAGTDASDTQFMSNRPTLAGSPAIRIAGRRALTLAGIDVDDLDLVDLYSCFPVAVQIAAHEIGLSIDRDLTVTGGLTFAGGPWSNYVTHSIATMVERLRDNGGSGLISANGGYLTKHAFGVYSARPPTTPFAWERPQDEVDAAGRVESCASFDGKVTVEGYTVMHQRDGSPERGVAAVRLPDGRRAWGATTDAPTMAAMETEEYVGRSGSLTADGSLMF